MKYFEIIDKNVAVLFQLQWKTENISDIFLQYSVLCGYYLIFKNLKFKSEFEIQDQNS